MNERLTKDISRYQSYCQFELKDCRYKDIYDFEHYSELEEYVDCDLTLGIDKLGEYENIDTDPKRLAKVKQAFEIIKDLFDFDFAIRFPTNQPMLMIVNKRTNEYWEIPITQEQFDLLNN